MREALFIILVVLILLAWTAFRYRKQISSILGFARMLQDAKSQMTAGPRQIQQNQEKGIPLVNCSKCAVWVPQSKARKVGELFYCSDECVRSRSKV
ncbi:MAG: PP0621 family protein [Pyrinomonadaceae bacterium]